jgi:hypothetical protein
MKGHDRPFWHLQQQENRRRGVAGIVQPPLLDLCILQEPLPRVVVRVCVYRTANLVGEYIKRVPYLQFSARSPHNHGRLTMCARATDLDVPAGGTAKYPVASNLKASVLRGRCG